ncbi:MAG: hypothetical protein NkDv07_0303 [Candidatus Improbicoccus devescovinae]|nr:MAG: hypothetical protein NkDv07_0303 [Candidatus Improbicoccus devescovinae]
MSSHKIAQKILGILLLFYIVLLQASIIMAAASPTDFSNLQISLAPRTLSEFRFRLPGPTVNPGIKNHRQAETSPDRWGQQLWRNINYPTDTCWPIVLSQGTAREQTDLTCVGVVWCGDPKTAGAIAEGVYYSFISPRNHGERLDISTILLDASYRGGIKSVGREELVTPGDRMLVLVAQKDKVLIIPPVGFLHEIYNMVRVSI